MLIKLVLWAHPDAIKYNTINQWPVSGAPSRHQRPRQLNFVNTKITKTIHTEPSIEIPALASAQEMTQSTGETANIRGEMASVMAREEEIPRSNNGDSARRLKTQRIFRSSRRF
jgi:hypothetical protein